MAAEAGGGKPGLSLHALPPSLAGSNVPAFSSIPDPGFALKKTTGKKEKKKKKQQQEEKRQGYPAGPHACETVHDRF